MGDVKIALMKLCILDNDVLDPEMAPVYVSYAAMTERLLRQAGAQGEMDVFHPYHGHYPSDWNAYDAVLLTGSRADAFSDAPWVVNLRAQVTQLLAAHKKLVGICFGHQLIALCLGATVGRAPQGRGCRGRQWRVIVDQ
jgi:GMP synthase-like glutamine amidotransferase